MQKYIHEIVEEAEKKKTIQERIDFLKQYADRKALKGLLEISYNKDIQILLPDTDPPYRESELPEGMNYTRIDTELRRFDIFLANGRYPNMNQTKREQIFIDILEALHPKEAEIFLRAFQHKFRIKGLRIKHINEIFGLRIPEPASKKTAKNKESNTE